VSVAVPDPPATEPASTIRIPRGRALTVDDLDHFPLGDGNRYELVEGMLLVSPSPIPAHQACVLRIGVALEAARTGDLLVFCAPLDWKVSDDTVFEPDVVVCRPQDLTQKRLEGPPLLCVEVLSQSWRRALRREHAVPTRDHPLHADRRSSGGVTAPAHAPGRTFRRTVHP